MISPLPGSMAGQFLRLLAGESTYRNEYIYHDSTGQLTSVRHNIDGDPTHDVVYTFGYDALGRKTTVHVDKRLSKCSE